MALLEEHVANSVSLVRMKLAVCFTNVSSDRRAVKLCGPTSLICNVLPNKIRELKHEMHNFDAQYFQIKRVLFYDANKERIFKDLVECG